MTADTHMPSAFISRLVEGGSRKFGLAPFAVALCVVAITWIFLQSGNLIPEGHADYASKLRDLRETDARLDGEVLANRLELVRNYDALTFYVKQTTGLAASLKELPPFLQREENAAIRALAEKLQASVNDKAEGVDRFKRTNSILRNSLAYLPMASDELSSGKFGAALNLAAERYTRAVLAWETAPQRGKMDDIAQKEAQLRSLAGASRAEADNLIRHGRQVIQQHLEIDRVIDEIAHSGSRQDLEDLRHQYEQDYANHAANVAWHRKLLYAFALALAASLVWLFFRLEKTRHSLFNAHAEISERYAAQLLVEKQLNLHAAAFQNAHDGIILTKPDGEIIDVNPAFTRITGWQHDEAIGQRTNMLKSGRHDAIFYRNMWDAIKESGFWHGEIWNRNKDGEIYPELLSISAVYDAQGEIGNYVAVFADIRVLKDQEHQLTRLAYYDALTNLPNRVLFAERLQQAIAHARRTGTMLAVCYMDLDGFKPINDSWGHTIGDLALVEIAKRLRLVLRDTDTAARLGGDEFALLLMDITSEHNLTEIANRLLRTIGAPLTELPESLRLTASLGITLVPQDDSDPDTLLRHADQAMYRAKESGKNKFRLFDTERDRHLRSHRDNIQRLAQALDDGEFVLYFQPKVALGRGEVTGAEALVRWRHPERGVLPPGEFLPLIEHDDLIKRLGDWVIETALAKMTEWRKEGIVLPVSVNLAARQLQAPDFIEHLKNVLSTYPDVAGQLELEILETVALTDIGQSTRIIEECRALGVRFALDDFGTGYSSLAYLKRLPAETIKIDRSFTQEILSDSHSLAIVQSVIGLARSFQRNIVAEGVENVEQGRLLIQLGCEYAQGYGIAPPMPGERFASWVQAWQAPVEWTDIRHIEWHAAVYPMLMAEVTHRSWVENLAERIRAGVHLPDDLPASTCSFGEWLRHEESRGSTISQLPEFTAVIPAHRRLHAMAETIARLREYGRQGEISECLPELLAAWNAFLDVLKDLEIASSTVTRSA